MKKVRHRIVGCIAGVLLAAFVITSAEDAAGQGVLDVKPLDVTILWGAEAEVHGNIEFSGRDETQGEKPHLWSEDWTSVDDYLTWDVKVAEAGDYQVAITYATHGAGGAQYEIVAGDSKVTGVVHKIDGWLPGWGEDYSNFEEEQLAGTLHLPKGPVTITLRATTKPQSGEIMGIYTVELTPLAALDILAAAKERAAKMRASTDWFIDATYGVTFHWNVGTKPRRGDPKSYLDAVRVFDVDAFAKMVEGTGAGYVIFTMPGHHSFFPAPIKTIEKIMPGSTCDRDLIGDLADALIPRGVRLMLYYPGGRARGDFGTASGYTKEDKTEYHNNFCAILSEIGSRYGKKVSGYWFDFCPFNVSHQFERFYKATKTGNPDRIVAWNSWVQRQPSDFQEYWAGEMATFRVVPKPNHFKNLQAHAWIIVDNSGNWGHGKLNTDIAPPLQTDQELIDFVKACAAEKVVVSMNVGIYQDGTISPEMTSQLRALKEAIKGK